MLQSETVKKYDTYKDSEIEWIGEIPQNWDRTRLKRLLSTPITDGPHETPELLDNGIPFLSAEAVKNNKLNFDLKRGYISHEEHLRFCKKCKPQLNDIFMIKSGATTGNVAIVDTTEEFSIWSPLALIRADESILYFKYLFYYLQSYVFKNQVELFWSYGTQQNIGMEVLGNLYIAFSKMITEQKHIAEYLDKKCGAIDEVIETEKSVIEKLKEYKQSIITEAVTKGLDKSAPLKDSGIEWIGKIPQHWDLMPLKFALNQRFEKNDPVQTEERLSLSIGLGVTLYSEKTTNLDRYKDDCSQYKLAYPDDLVINSMNVIVGAVGISKYFGCVSPAYYVLYSSDENKFKTEFFDYLFKTSTIRKFLFSIGKGIMAIERGNDRVNTCRLKVSAYDLGRLNFPIPSKQEQEEICNYLDKKCSEIDKAIADKELVIEKFTEYKKSLIYECVTGKRKVVE